MSEVARAFDGWVGAGVARRPAARPRSSFAIPRGVRPVTLLGVGDRALARRAARSHPGAVGERQGRSGPVERIPPRRRAHRVGDCVRARAHGAPRRGRIRRDCVRDRRRRVGDRGRVRVSAHRIRARVQPCLPRALGRLLRPVRRAVEHRARIGCASALARAGADRADLYRFRDPSGRISAGLRAAGRSAVGRRYHAVGLAGSPPRIDTARSKLRGRVHLSGVARATRAARLRCAYSALEAAGVGRGTRAHVLAEFDPRGRGGRDRDRLGAWTQPPVGHAWRCGGSRSRSRSCPR